MTWPTSAPAVQPTTHDQVAQQAYRAGGGDYFRSGYYYGGLYSTGAGSAQSLAVGLLVATPFLVPCRRAFSAIGMQVSAAATSAVSRLGIYSTSAGIPSALVIDAGTVSAATTGAKSAAISVTLDPGLYWLTHVTQVAGPISLTGYVANTYVPLAPWASASIGTGPLSNSTFPFPSVTGVTGALPATFPTMTGSESRSPILQLQAL